MKKPSKNEIDVLSLINQIQAQLTALDKKVDTLIFRSLPDIKQTPKPSAPIAPTQAKPIDRNKGRTMHTAICADCKKECTIPFKPSGDRPVYCKDCFSRRKVISLSGIKIDGQFKPVSAPEATVLKEIDVPTAKAKTKAKKKAVAIKKPVAKKKSAPKKK
jgi:CxxC-x17-CxxC domain-containing protein